MERLRLRPPLVTGSQQTIKATGDAPKAVSRHRDRFITHIAHGPLRKLRRFPLTTEPAVQPSQSPPLEPSEYVERWLSTTTSR